MNLRLAAAGGVPPYWHATLSRSAILPPMPRPAQPVPESVPFFRPRRHGPESTIEDSVIRHLPLFFETQHPMWTAGSVPLGAGFPDLIHAAYHTLVTDLAEAEAVDTNILAYLRAVGRARPDTIATRLQLPLRRTERRVRMLLEADALTDHGGSVALTPTCRELLPTVTAIEVKVCNWRRALSQALRNRVFAHRSYIALPVDVATRVRRVPVLRHSGIGIIAVQPDGEASMLKHAATRQPTVWAYYYRLATLVGQRVARVE